MAGTGKEDGYYSAVNVDEDKKQNVQLPTIGVRHWQALLLFIMFFTAFGCKIIPSVAIVAMTDPKASINPDIPTYNWSDKGAILSAFFWGYLWTQVIAGYMVNRFGAKWFLIGTMFIQSLLIFLTPWTAANFGSLGMCISRAVQGLCQGFVPPSLTHQLSQWAPHEERSRMGAFTMGASSLGTVIAILGTGLISSTWYGWPLVFYIYGSLGVFWCILFTFLGYNSPAVHPTISKAEKYYIEASLGHTDEKPTHKIPWANIFKSVPVWAIFIVQVGNNYFFWTLATNMPSYMSHVMHFNLQNNSVLSSLPYLALWFVCIAISFISDNIVNRNLVTVGTARKIFTSIGLLVPAAALIALGYTRPEETTKAVVLLIIAVSANGACISGYNINHMDLSPNFAGTLTGLTNGFSHASAILAPLIVQSLINDESDPQQWRIVFFLAAGIVAAGAMLFNIFGSGDVQPWNEDNDKKEGSIN